MEHDKFDLADKAGSHTPIVDLRRSASVSVIACQCSRSAGVII